MGSANNSLGVRKVVVRTVDSEVYRPVVSILSAKVSELAADHTAPVSGPIKIKISQPDSAEPMTEYTNLMPDSANLMPDSANLMPELTSLITESADPMPELAELTTGYSEVPEQKPQKPEIAELKSETPAEIKVTINPSTENPAITPESSLKETISNAKPAKKRPLWQTLLSGFSTALTAVFVLVAGALVGMKLAGFRAFTVMSGSMAESYPVGSLIYVQPVDYRTLSVGDVISYVANDDNTVVTHRIVEIEVDKNDPDVWRFRTKGDENSSPDARPVHYKNVLGTPIITIPTLGYLAHSIQQPPGIYAALVVGTLLLAWTFLPGTLEERRRTTKKSVA